MGAQTLDTELHIQMPNAVKLILDRLQTSGYDAYIVGGCIRDSLIGREPKDWDICTSAKPEAVMGLFPKVIPKGVQYGTVGVVIDGIQYEITTFRDDGKYSDGRHPDEVSYVNDVTDDLARRDYTINAIAYNDSSGIIDPEHGIDDIISWTIRCVGNPDQRFEEDPLRILRGIRFAVSMPNFCIDIGTKQSMQKHIRLLRQISKERICDEVLKILSYGFHQKRDAFEIFYSAFKLIISEYITIRYPSLDMAYSQIERCIDAPEVSLSILLKGANLNAIGDILSFLRMPKKFITSVISIVDCGKMMVSMFGSKKISYSYNYLARLLLHDAGKELSQMVLLYITCTSDYTDEVNMLMRTIPIILKSGDPYDLSMLNVSGSELFDLGFEGREIGYTLNQLLLECMQGTIENKNEKLIKRAVVIKNGIQR